MFSHPPQEPAGGGNGAEALRAVPQPWPIPAMASPPTSCSSNEDDGYRPSGSGLTGPGGQPLRVTPHQLRHTLGTTQFNAGMSLQALMALMGHVSAEMTLRYASLASPTVRAAYEAAMSKVHLRQSLFVVSTGRAGARRRTSRRWRDRVVSRLSTAMSVTYLTKSTGRWIPLRT